jgi:hypothetical protein
MQHCNWRGNGMIAWHCRRISGCFQNSASVGTETKSEFEKYNEAIFSRGPDNRTPADLYWR